jgi:hypothetical protein
VPKPVTLFRIVRASGGGRRAGQRHLTPLVGREEELSILMRRWERARQGDGQLEVIVRKPGLRKSRLKEALSNGVIPGTTQRCVGTFDELIGKRSDCVCQNAFSVTEIGPRDEPGCQAFRARRYCGVGGALVERRPLLDRQDQGSPVPARANVQVCYGNERTDGCS